MFERPCFCGTSKKNFKMDIGTNYFDDCCREKGLNELEIIQRLNQPTTLIDLDLWTQFVRLYVLPLPLSQNLIVSTEGTNQPTISLIMPNYDQMKYDQLVAERDRLGLDSRLKKQKHLVAALKNDWQKRQNAA